MISELMKTKRLQSEIVAVTDITDAQAGELFTIYNRCYDNVDWPRFQRDLREKDFVILLRDTGCGEPRGFSTQKVMRIQIGGETLRALFSGDTIIDPSYWGEQELVRAWGHFAGRILSEEPGIRLFWFLISKGYRTYMYLPLFFREFFPRRGHATPAFEQEMMHTLALTRYPEDYNPVSGLLEFSVSEGNLNPQLAEIPPGRQDHPDVQFFLSKNPSYACGNELVCLAEIAPANMRSFAVRLIREGMEIGPITQPVALQYA